MITVQLAGQIGNILFQYAVGRALALRHGTTLRLDLTPYAIRERGRFGRIVSGMMRRMPLEASVRQSPLPLAFAWKVARRFGAGPLADSAIDFRERQYFFDRSVLSLPDGSVLKGYFQDERYFAEIGTRLREEIAIRPPPPGSREAALEAEIRGGPSISVHVRRGDYLGSSIFETCGADYFVRAVELVRGRCGKARVFVFSDDIAWCREALRIPDIRFVEQGDPLSDMRCMSLCGHNVIANSSYSWWAAWINANPGKTVVAPARWIRERVACPRPCPQHLPEGWIRLDA